MPTQRIHTGVPGLDDLLYGGLLPGDAVLVAGAPGTGKSTLGMQFLYEGIQRYNEPGFFITFEEFPQQIYRDALNFGWDFRRLEEDNQLKVLFTSPDLMYQDIKRHEGIFPEMIREIGAKRVVVDSLTHFKRLASDPGDLREIIYSLINALKREGLTPLLLRELVEGEMMGTVAEEYTADVVIHLTAQRIQGQRMRFLEILKSRGSRHMPAQSLFFLGDRGVDVLPPYQEAFFRYQEAISVGVPDLDRLLGGGIPYGAFYLCEMSPAFHQELFELNFLKETVLAQDHLLMLETGTRQLEKLRHLTQTYAMADDYGRALEADTVRVINLTGATTTQRLEGDTDEPFVLDPDQVLLTTLTQLDEALQQTSRAHRGRVLLDITRLLTAVEEDYFFALFSAVLELIQQYGAICLGFVNPAAIPPATRERLRMEADGLVCMWDEGSYKYVQVLKTVNSVITPVSALIEVPMPPYMRILQN
jgi:circadian clock protein KaiC